MDINKIYNIDCLEGLKQLPDQSINCCVTSPPYYGLRDYGVDGQIGLEETPELYVERLVNIFREVKRVLRDDGVLWLNLGDSYAGSGKGSNPDGTPHPSTLNGKQGTNKGTVTGINKPQKAKSIGLKPKDLIGIPWLVAFALRADGWYLRQDVIWAKNNPMPESVTDRCTKSHEYVFLLSKSVKYHFDHKSIQEPSKSKVSGSTFGDRGGQLQGLHSGKKWIPQHKNLQDKGQPNHTFHERRAYGLADTQYQVRNKRDVWFINTKPYKGAHFAVFPEELIKPCILAGCPEGGLVLDPFMGAGTTAMVAQKFKRNYIGFELNASYVEIANKRLLKELAFPI